LMDSRSGMYLHIGSTGGSSMLVQVRQETVNGRQIPARGNA
jgi:hypothetical protein